MLTEEQLREIEARANTATLADGWVGRYADTVQDVLDLVAEVRELQAENERLRGCANCRHAIPTGEGFVRCEVYCHIVALPCMTWEAAQ